MREHLFTCESCATKIYEGDNYHSGVDVELCAECAPTFADMVAHPDSFKNGENEPMTADEARQALADHIAAGGKPDDKMISR